MYDTGISFGTHTKTHPILSLLTDKQIEEEIIESKAAIESELGDRVTSFAYPNGQPSDFDHRCKRVLKKNGFAFAVTTSCGLNTACTDRYELFRGRPWDRHPNQFYGRLLLTRFSS